MQVFLFCSQRRWRVPRSLVRIPRAGVSCLLSDSAQVASFMKDSTSASLYARIEVLGATEARVFCPDLDHDVNDVLGLTLKSSETRFTGEFYPGGQIAKICE